MNKKLLSKKTVVTGASTGIGREISIALASEGAQVALIGRNEQKLKETQKLINEIGGEATIFIADLRKDATKVGEEINNSFGDVDIIVNAAGVWHNEDIVYYGPKLWELSEHEILEVMQVGIIAPMLLTKTLLPNMVDKKYGKIINISGTFESGAKSWMHYYVSKKALEDFTIGLAQEVREHMIQVNCVCPSDTATDSYKKFYPRAKDYEPFEDCMDPKDIAKLVLQLAIDDFDFITGQIIVARNKKSIS